MTKETPVLQGKHIRLEPLEHRHVEGLVAAAGDDAALYQWSPVPRGKAAATTYIDTALAWKDAGTAVPFAIMRRQDSVVIGSTRFWNIERWAWPPVIPRTGAGPQTRARLATPGWPRSATRTGANTEAKLLMLTHAFEVWRVLRVCFHTDARNSVLAPRSNASAANLKGSFALTGWLRILSPAIRYATRSSRRSGQR